jgi:hypothetical protein
MYTCTVYVTKRPYSFKDIKKYPFREAFLFSKCHGQLLVHRDFWSNRFGQTIGTFKIFQNILKDFI